LKIDQIDLTSRIEVLGKNRLYDEALFDLGTFQLAILAQVDVDLNNIPEK
jgi:hypothetical protein